MPPSSTPSTPSTTILASVVFLTFKLLLSLGVLSQYSLLFCNLLGITLYPDGRLGQVGWPSGMRFLAILAIWAETSEVKFTESLPDMFLGAVRSEGAESLFIVWAWG